MNAALEISAALLVWLAGGAGAALLALPARGARRSEFAALAILFGFGLVTLGLFCFGLAGLRHAALRAAVTALAAAVCAGGFFRARRIGLRFSPVAPARKTLAAALGLLLAAEWLVVAWQTANHPIGWDGLFVWEIKARIAFLSGGWLPREFFTDASRVWSHADYPPGVPLAESWFYGFLGEPHQGVAKAFCPFFHLAALCLFVTAAAKFRVAESWRGAAAATVLFFTPSVIFHPGGAISGWADFPLGVIYLAAVVYLLDYARGGSAAALRIFSLCLALLPWVKRDGAVLWASLLVIGAVIGWRRRELARVLLAGAPGLAVLAGWKLFLARAHVPANTDLLAVTPGVLLEHIERLSMVALFLLRESVNLSRWSLLWPALLAALWQLARRVDTREAATLLAAAIFLPAGCFGGVYCFSAWPDVWLHIATSFPRLLIDVAPAAALATALALPAFPTPDKTT